MAIEGQMHLGAGVSEKSHGVPELDVLIYRASDAHPVLHYYLRWGENNRYECGRHRGGMKKYPDVPLPNGYQPLEFRLEQKDTPLDIKVYSLGRTIDAYIISQERERDPQMISRSFSHTFHLQKNDHLQINLPGNESGVDNYVDIVYRARDGPLDFFLRALGKVFGKQ